VEKGGTGLGMRGTWPISRDYVLSVEFRIALASSLRYLMSISLYALLVFMF
jgi:hypothetical protein